MSECPELSTLKSKLARAKNRYMIALVNNAIAKHKKTCGICGKHVEVDEPSGNGLDAIPADLLARVDALEAWAKSKGYEAAP